VAEKYGDVHGETCTGELDSIEIFVFSAMQLSVLKKEREKNRQCVRKIGLSQFAAVIG
jgi:hypothetical protein